MNVIFTTRYVIIIIFGQDTLLILIIGTIIGASESSKVYKYSRAQMLTYNSEFTVVEVVESPSVEICAFFCEFPSLEEYK